LPKFDGLTPNIVVPNGYGSLNWGHLSVVKPVNATPLFSPILPQSGSQVVKSPYYEVPYVTQGTGNNLYVTIDSFYFGCSYNTAPFKDFPAPCSLTVLTKASIQVATVATYGPFKAKAIFTGGSQDQAMTKVVGPFAGQYIQFVITGGPGNVDLYMDSFQISNVYSGSACSSLG